MSAIRAAKIIRKIDSALAKDARKAGLPRPVFPNGWPCHYCGRIMQDGDKWLRPTRDHVLPRSGPGRNKARNVVWACHACNQLKGDMHPNFWRALMDRVPRWWEMAPQKGPRGIALVQHLRSAGVDFSGAGGPDAQAAPPDA